MSFCQLGLPIWHINTPITLQMVYPAVVDGSKNRIAIESPVKPRCTSLAVVLLQKQIRIKEDDGCRKDRENTL